MQNYIKVAVLGLVAVCAVYAASAVRGNLGCVEKIVNASLGDTYDFRYDSNTNADTVTTRAATFSVIKLQSL